MFERTAALLAAICLSIYWAWVLVKLVLVGLKLGKDPNAVPRERVGQLMRLLWYPCIMALLVGLWVAAGMSSARLERLPEWMRAPFLPLWRAEQMGNLWWAMVLPAAVLCVAFTAFTFVCWRKMGTSWRIGIDPGEKLAMVSTGPYRFVRHPIYALRMVIDLCAVLMAPSPLVLIAAFLDFALLQIEARREERYMESKHGQEYARYKQAVGRFVPRSWSHRVEANPS